MNGSSNPQARDGDVDPLDAAASDRPGVSDPQDPFARKYRVWKERLLDLTAANRLLNFRSLRVASVHITTPRIEELFDHLVVREHALRFPRYEGRVALSLATDAGYGDGEADGVQRAQYRVTPGDLDVADKAPPELEKSLYRLTQLARSSREERGVNTLYLALGMLVWQPKEDARPQRAPLVLLPVDLKRETILSHFSLSAFDEDPEVNPTLIYMLKRDFDFDLPALSGESELDGNGLISFLLNVTEAMAGRGWQVEDSAWLAQFNFKKLAMYRDLETTRRRRSRIPGSPRSLGSEPLQAPPGRTPPTLSMRFHPLKSLA